MAYLVIDLQSSAIDHKIGTTTLLRKALMVAKKLKLDDFQDWINAELNGYHNNKSNIPEYREVHGQLKAYNPYNGWIPTLFNGNTEMQNVVTTRKIPDSISQLEFLMDSKGDSLCLTYPASIESQLGQMFGFDTQYQLFVSKAQFKGILESVRTAVMNWALELECDGILGDEMIFSDKEKEIAVQKNYTVNNFYGNVNHSQIQQHSKDSNQKR